MSNNQTPFEILTDLFSDRGFCHGAFCLSLIDHTNITLTKTDDGFSIKFLDNQPIVKVRRLIPLKATVTGLKLETNGGVLELDSFPDISFRYEWIMEDEYKAIITAKESIMEEIPLKFKKEKHRKIAQKVLTLCEEWTIIKGIEEVRSMSEKQSKEDCKNFIEKRLNEEVVGLGFVLTIILGVIIKKIVEWIIDKYILNIRR